MGYNIVKFSKIIFITVKCELMAINYNVLEGKIQKHFKNFKIGPEGAEIRHLAKDE